MTTLKINSPADLPNAVDQILGFRPTNSYVMLCFGGMRPFHARVDIGPIDTIAPALIDPAIQQQVQQVVLLAYDGDMADLSALGDAFEDTGIGVVALVTVEVTGDMAKVVDRSGNEWQVPMDVACTRDGITEGLQPRGTGEPIPAEERDEILRAITRENAKKHLAVLSARLRNSPEAPETAPLAGLVALAAWQAGDGATAWVAVDVAKKCGPSVLADYVSHMLTTAAPPETWESFRAILAAE